jgi:hypothetical protein
MDLERKTSYGRILVTEGVARLLPTLLARADEVIE